MLACLHALVGGARLGERVDGVHHRLRLAALDELEGALEVLLRAHRRAEDRQLLPPDAVERGLRVRPARRPADRDPAVCPDRLERGLPRRLAHVLDDDVGAGPPVASRTVSSTSPVLWLTTASAPRPRASSTLASLDDVVTTRAPSARASTIAAVPIPLPAPQTSTHSPSRSPARVTSIRYAVSETSGNAAASSKESSSGMG